MKERYTLPPPACAALCRNAMNEVCIEECSPNRDCSSFELREDIGLLEMPGYPDTSRLTWKERFVIEEAYTRKLTEHLQGKELQNGRRFSKTRPYSYSSGDTKTSEDWTHRRKQVDQSEPAVFPSREVDPSEGI
jgi:hypothetical protein